jgi:hypothetical protein
LPQDIGEKMQLDVDLVNLGRTVKAVDEIRADLGHFLSQAWQWPAIDGVRAALNVGCRRTGDIQAA